MIKLIFILLLLLPLFSGEKYPIIGFVIKYDNHSAWDTQNHYMSVLKTENINKYNWIEVITINNLNEVHNIFDNNNNFFYKFNKEEYDILNKSSIYFKETEFKELNNKTFNASGYIFNIDKELIYYDIKSNNVFNIIKNGKYNQWKQLPMNIKIVDDFAETL